MFIKESKKTYRYIDTESDIIIKSLESRLYEVEYVESMFSSYYNFNENNAYDKGKIAESGVFKEVKEYIFDFFSKEGKEVRDAMALPNRLGMLFTGEPGTGKTFLAGQLAKQLCLRENAVAITTTKPAELDLGKVVDMARKNDPNRLVVMIWDEFEKNYSTVERKERDKLLSFLDGVDSRDNVVILATCNDLSIFPDTFLKRPGRFEKVTEFKIEDKGVLETLLKAMIPEQYKEKLDFKLMLGAVSEIPNISVDAIKSFVRDSLVRALQGKEDYIAKITNNCIVEEEDLSPEEQAAVERAINRFKQKKFRVEDIRDSVSSESWKADVPLSKVIDYSD